MIKFIRFSVHNKATVGILSKDETNIIPVSAVIGGHTFEEMQQVIEYVGEKEVALLHEAMEHPESYTNYKKNEVMVLAPIECPRHDILCVGVNYAAHMQEAKDKVALKESPKKTVYFAKRACSILGSGDTIRGRFDIDDELDYEVELAVIIGKEGKDIKEEEVEDYIFGYSVFNDVSSRKLQRQHAQWYRGKSLDTYTAMGPVILHKSALPFPVKVDVISRLNGEERQHSNTSLLVADLKSLIVELSQGMTLEAGDIIATGTPAGVGMGFDPPRYMKSGDVIECEIPEIGILKNIVK